MHLYVHVPFCARRCTYCDFAIAVRRAVPSDGFVRAVLAEWEAWQSHPGWADSPEVRTVYLGGGTPSRLDPGAIGRLLDGIAARRPVAPDAEVTLEANPDDVTREAPAAWRAAGVNRVSLGAQSFHPAVLRWMHRTHAAEDVATAVRRLRGAGIGAVSLDLIYAVPADLGRDWPRDLAHALALAPEHLSFYGLTVEERTPLHRLVRRGDAVPAADTRYAEEFLHATRTLAERGYEHYEVSNAALPGHRARHNSAYWRRAPFIGLGPSAHSGIGAERRWNLRDWAAYERAFLAGAPVVAGRETLDAAAIRLEEVYLGLRAREGAPAGLIPRDLAAAWVAEGWAVADPDRVRLTAEGWLRLDALAAAAG